VKKFPLKVTSGRVTEKESFAEEEMFFYGKIV
jgi:hypothetical protein